MFCFFSVASFIITAEQCNIISSHAHRALNWVVINHYIHGKTETLPVIFHICLLHVIEQMYFRANFSAILMHYLSCLHQEMVETEKAREELLMKHLAFSLKAIDYSLTPTATCEGDCVGLGNTNELPLESVNFDDTNVKTFHAHGEI